MGFRKRSTTESHTKLLIILVAAVVAVILSPYLIKAYYIETQEPSLGIQANRIDKRQIGGGKCEIGIEGEIGIDSRYTLDEINLEGEVIGEDESGEEKKYYRYPESLKGVSEDTKFKVTLEKIPLDCESIQEIEISIDSYKRSVF